MYMSVWGYLQLWIQCLQRPEEFLVSAETGVIGNCEPPELESGSPAQVLCKGSVCLISTSESSISPGHKWVLDPDNLKCIKTLSVSGQSSR